jgi:hemerythrin
MARTKHTISVGCAALDVEHEMQLGLLNALQRALSKGRRQAVIDDLFTQLIGFTSAHHQAEQLLMRLYDYPDYTAHCEEHERLIAQLNTLHE